MWIDYRLCPPGVPRRVHHSRLSCFLSLAYDALCLRSTLPSDSTFYLLSALRCLITDKSICRFQYLSNSSFRLLPSLLHENGYEAVKKDTTEALMIHVVSSIDTVAFLLSADEETTRFSKVM
ncbi:hypothetical protein L1887_36299 [Cichorium endivia]|nr:hypothetical protein L1887_36299 [Cichorium endivia]